MSKNITDFKDQVITAVIANLALSLLCGTFVQTIKSNKLIVNKLLKTIVEQPNSVFYWKCSKV